MSRRWAVVLVASGALAAGWWLADVAEARERQRGTARSGDAIAGQSLQLTSASGRASNASASSTLASGKVKAKHRTSDERRQRTVAESGHAIGGQLASVTGDLVLVDRSQGQRTITDTVPEDLERLERPRHQGCAARIRASDHADGRAYAMGVACEVGGRRLPIRELTVLAPAGHTWDGFLAPGARCSFTRQALTCADGPSLLLVLYGDLPPGSLITFTANGLTWTERAPP